LEVILVCPISFPFFPTPLSFLHLEALIGPFVNATLAF
jgi:hypothetical protein